MIVAYSTGMFVNVTVFTLCQYMSIPELFSLLVATGFSFIINFFLSNKYVFDSKSTQKKYNE